LCHLDVGAAERRRVYYREYGGGILPSPGCDVSKPEVWCVQVNPSARDLSLHQKDPKWILTNSCWFVMQVRVI
jgi:hypothetical protein